jgi:polar amino acid transport system permease protein
MSAVTDAPPNLDDIVERVADAQTRTRRGWRLQFALTWIVLLALLVAALWVTGNVNLDFIASAGPYIVQGAGLTIVICLSSIVLATVLALFGALGRLSTNPIVNGIASLYVSIVRGTPLLVQIFFVYLALPQLGVTLPVIVGGILALGFNYGAYMTEIFRAGIQAVPRGQREAAGALGMPESLVFRRIVMPQAFRIVTPAIGNDFIAMIKDSSLVYVLGVQELLWRASTLGRRNLASLEGLLIAAAVYWALTLVFSFFQDKLEKRMARGDR